MKRFINYAGHQWHVIKRAAVGSGRELTHNLIFGQRYSAPEELTYIVLLTHIPDKKLLECRITKSLLSATDLYCTLLMCHA